MSDYIELLKDTYGGYFEGLSFNITVIGLIGILFLGASIFFLIKVSYEKAMYKRNMMKYLIKKGKKSPVREITKLLMKNKFLRSILSKIAIKIGMVSRYNYSKNLEIATELLLGAVVLSLMIMFSVLPAGNLLWYELLIYIAIAVIVIVVAGYLFFATLRTMFIGKLPDVYKILDSRYISKGNILKAIDVSLDDFDRVIRKEMMKIYNVLKKNDMQEIELAFKEMELTYNTEYLTILLSLIKQAHFKGGNDVIKQQFETITEEILQEIENQRDLSSTSRSYIMMALFIPLVLKFIAKFNETSIGADAADFYLSPAGKWVGLGTILMTLGYIGLLLFLERSV